MGEIFEFSIDQLGTRLFENPSSLLRKRDWKQPVQRTMDQVDRLVSCPLEIANRKIHRVEYARHRGEMSKRRLDSKTD